MAAARGTRRVDPWRITVVAVRCVALPAKRHGEMASRLRPSTTATALLGRRPRLRPWAGDLGATAMDMDHFDRATKILSTAGTRRGLVHLVAAVPVLGVLLAAADEEANAERPHERMHRRTQQRNRKQRNRKQRNTNKNNDGGGGNDNNNNRNSCCHLGETNPCASVLKS